MYKEELRRYHRETAQRLGVIKPLEIKPPAIKLIAKQAEKKLTAKQDEKKKRKICRLWDHDIGNAEAKIPAYTVV